LLLCMGLFSIFWLRSENRVNLAARKSLACRAVARAKQPAFARRDPAGQPYALRESEVDRLRQMFLFCSIKPQG
jgi:hypothetical protein